MKLRPLVVRRVPSASRKRTGIKPPPGAFAKARAAARPSRPSKADPLTFTAQLYAPMQGKGWTFADLPAAASEALGQRGRVAVVVTVGGEEFRTSCFPDGKGGHMLQLNAAMRAAAGAEAGDEVRFALRPDDGAMAVEVPPDLRRAIAADRAAATAWKGLTPKAQAAWVAWVTGAKRAETRERRVAATAERVAGGERWPSA